MYNVAVIYLLHLYNTINKDLIYDGLSILSSTTLLIRIWYTMD